MGDTPGNQKDFASTFRFRCDLKSRILQIIGKRALYAMETPAEGEERLDYNDDSILDSHVERKGGNFSYSLEFPNTVKVVRADKVPTVWKNGTLYMYFDTIQDDPIDPAFADFY